MNDKKENSTVGKSELHCRVMPQCKTCEYWVMNKPGTEEEFPYCHELQYWMGGADVRGPIHTPADFGCNKHSELN